MDAISTIRRIIESKDFSRYKGTHLEIILLKYGPGTKRAWHIVSDEVIVPFDSELR